MFKPRIAIFGASGFVGSALAERLFFDKGYDFVPLIHSFGNAARLARLPIELKPVDILDFNRVNRVLSGCNVVVNCSRGGNAIMLKGLKNIIKASQENKVEKFIHIGSIAIYGNDPSITSKNENGLPNPESSYAVAKLKQDDMVFKLHSSGIPSLIICPSNISGPYSLFVIGAVRKLLSNEIVLVDDGKYPANLIHVDNLVEAIITAIESDKGWGERYFINEIEPTTWKDFYEDLKEMLGIKIELPSISRDEIVRELVKSKNGFRMSNILKVLISREFRSAMDVIPGIKKLNESAMELFLRQKSDVQTKLMLKLKGPTIIKKEKNRIDVNESLIRVQVRQVYHSPEKIMSKMNYSPLLNYQQRKETTNSWFNHFNIVN